MYMVETLCGGTWDDIWTEDCGKGAKPLRFKTIAEALVELEDHFKACDDAGIDYDREHYRIVEARHD